jgi:hypothetical protein
VSDWKLDADGDLLIQNGDFVIADESDAIAQELEFRIRTERFGYGPDLELGAGLDRFRGQPGTKETGKQIERAVIQAITRDGKFAPDSIVVKVVPLDLHTVGLYVFVVPRFSGIQRAVRLSFTIDLDSGLISQTTGGTG